MRFTIIQDTREQNPWEFSPKVDVEVRTLGVGDYSLKGFTERIVIERKSMSDLMGSMTHGRERFKRELRRMQSYNLAVLVVEGSWQDIILGNYRSRMSPASAVGTIVSFIWKYGVMPVLAGTREHAALVAETILRQYAENIVRRHKLLVKAHKEKPDENGVA